jgi:hypothetical protein
MGERMHDFFRQREVPSDLFELPRRAYALLIDAEDKEYALFNVVDAQSFHKGAARSCSCGCTLNPTQ